MITRVFARHVSQLANEAAGGSRREVMLMYSSADTRSTLVPSLRRLGLSSIKENGDWLKRGPSRVSTANCIVKVFNACRYRVLR